MPMLPRNDSEMGAPLTRSSHSRTAAKMTNATSSPVRWAAVRVSCRPTERRTDAIGPLEARTGMAIPTTATLAAIAASSIASKVRRGATTTRPAGPMAPRVMSSPAASTGASRAAGTTRMSASVAVSLRS